MKSPSLPLTNPPQAKATKMTSFSIHFHSFFLLLLIISFLHFSIALATATDLLHQTCNKVSTHNKNINYHFCVNAIQSAPASHCANLSRLGLISINLITNNVTDTRCYIKRLLNNKKLDPMIKAALRDCMEVYTDSIPTTKEAARDYRAKRFYDAMLKFAQLWLLLRVVKKGLVRQE